MVQLNSLAANIITGNSPWDISVNPNANFVYVTNSDSDTISVIDGKTNSVMHL